MAPLKHIYPIRNDEIINELSETDVRIGKLEIEVEALKERVKTLNDMILNQCEINRNLITVIENLNK